MDQSQKQKLMTKILIGSAWIDRILEPEEQEYLKFVLDRYGLLNDKEINALLTTPPPMQTTERWLVEYFQNSTSDERMQLLANIGKVLIADDTVSEVEHDLLDDYHELMARIPARPEPKAKSAENEPESHSFAQDIGHIARKVGSFVVDMINHSRHSS